ncbi:DinB family protein [Pedobacter sp. V48]|uniref:DinB family protein n=1 Tax=Pedobacter sp. V48 TaxID=509635 RepID=UPI0004B8569F|nr:DinB family protein [Pedobacter sp. V48]
MEILINELKHLLEGGGAHVGLKDATANIPFILLGERPHQLPYSIWQLVEHIRIAQWDMLEFSRKDNHKSPKWPEEYWPKELAPADISSWDASLRQIAEDLNAFLILLQTENLYDPFLHGSGQSLLREALQIADHAAYHIAEIVVVRRLLGIWKP